MENTERNLYNLVMNGAMYRLACNGVSKTLTIPIPLAKEFMTMFPPMVAVMTVILNESESKAKVSDLAKWLEYDMTREMSEQFGEEMLTIAGASKDGIDNKKYDNFARDLAMLILSLDGE